MSWILFCIEFFVGEVWGIRQQRSCKTETIILPDPLPVCKLPVVSAICPCSSSPVTAWWKKYKKYIKYR